ncbi:hypothetical protein [Lacimicrobium alkaliphilum]|uniref:Bacterial repeat domain-containing protein n=1 Tax=Lacimicrobium alkaliphilum TaxID=1526571 RepID=A0ABQ1RNA6_9ALTE|nr:hypothetical protein [Lacimicrobium alkaliphilum]GGD72229.1 hypothetical protein GCM10011357_29050 [Lacimicrobium alkaliphilum]
MRHFFKIFISLLFIQLNYSPLAWAIEPEGLAFQANTTTVYRQEHPAVGSLTGGGFVVVWESDNQDGSEDGIYAQQYSAGGVPVGSEFRVNTHTDQYQQKPAVVGLDDGGYIVVWSSSGTYSGVYGQRYDASGTPVGAQFMVHTQWGQSGNGSDPAIASLKDGGFVVTWSGVHYDGSVNAVVGRRFQANGDPISGEFVINTYTHNNQYRSSVSALNDGGFAVVWESAYQDGSSSGVYGQLYDATNNPVGEEFRVNTDTYASQGFPSISTLENGEIVVIYESSAHDTTGVYLQSYDYDGEPIGVETRINAPDERGSMSSVASLEDGGFFVGWTYMSDDGTEIGLRGQKFSAFFEPVGEELNIAPTDQLSKRNGNVAALMDGGFLVVWAITYTNQQGITDREIFGQRYNQFSEPVELLVPDVNLNFTKTLSVIHDQDSDGNADKAVVFVPQVYDYRLSLDDLNGNLIDDEVRVTDTFDGWSMVYATPSIGAAVVEVVDGKTQLVWDLLGLDINTQGNAFVDIRVQESCGAKYIGGEAMFQRKPDTVGHFITEDVERPKLCVVRLFDANNDGTVKLDGTGDENDNGISDYVEACEMSQDPCL